MKKITEMYFPNLGELTVTSIISLLGAGIAQSVYKETIHGLAVIVAAVVGSVTVHLVKYYMNKKWPLK